MKRALLIVALLTPTAQRLPAPIQEVPETTPAPTTVEKREIITAHRNKLGMIDGKYVGVTTKAEFYLKSDPKQRTAGAEEHSNYFVIQGDRFSFTARHQLWPDALGVSGGNVRATDAYRGQVVMHGSGEKVYVFIPQSVKFSEKIPASLSDSYTGIAKVRKELRNEKWTLRYDEDTLIQPS